MRVWRPARIRTINHGEMKIYVYFNKYEFSNTDAVWYPLDSLVYETWKIHYYDVIMITTASQITSLMIVYSINRLSKAQIKETSRLRVTGLCAGNSPVTGEFLAQRVSYAENVSIWWRHHACTVLLVSTVVKKVNTYFPFRLMPFLLNHRLFMTVFHRCKKMTKNPVVTQCASYWLVSSELVPSFREFNNSPFNYH